MKPSHLIQIFMKTKKALYTKTHTFPIYKLILIKDSKNLILNRAYSLELTPILFKK